MSWIYNLRFNLKQLFKIKVHLKLKVLKINKTSLENMITANKNCGLMTLCFKIRFKNPTG